MRPYSSLNSQIDCSTIVWAAPAAEAIHTSLQSCRDGSTKIFSCVSSAANWNSRSRGYPAMDLTAVAARRWDCRCSCPRSKWWLDLNADPRALVNAGRWSLLALIGLAIALLVWLVNTGRWEAAMMPAAFMLPVVVQAAPRAAGPGRFAQWHAERIPPKSVRIEHPSSAASPRRIHRLIWIWFVSPLPCCALMSRRLADRKQQQLGDLHAGGAAPKRPGNGRRRMSIEGKRSTCSGSSRPQAQQAEIW